MAAAQPGRRYSGWWKNPATGNLEFWHLGVKIGHLTNNAFVLVKAIDITGGLTTTTSIAATTTITAGTGLTVTTGNAVVAAGDVRVTLGNVRLGVVSAFVTTEPTSAVVMKEGTAPAGAITTSGGIFSSATVVRKIIADGTVSNVET